METVASHKIEDELSRHGVCATSTVGVSMRPLFKTHRDAVVLKTPDREIKKYDVVLYTHPSGKYVLHRVIGIKDGVYIIRGDNCLLPEHIKDNEILGKLTGIYREEKPVSMQGVAYKFYSWAIVVLNPLVRLRAKLRYIKNRIIKK